MWFRELLLVFLLLLSVHVSRAGSATDLGFADCPQPASEENGLRRLHGRRRELMTSIRAARVDRGRTRRNGIFRAPSATLHAQEPKNQPGVVSIRSWLQNCMSNIFPQLKVGNQQTVTKLKQRIETFTVLAISRIPRSTQIIDQQNRSQGYFRASQGEIFFAGVQLLLAPITFAPYIFFKTGSMGARLLERIFALFNSIVLEKDPDQFERLLLRTLHAMDGQIYEVHDYVFPHLLPEWNINALHLFGELV